MNHLSRVISCVLLVGASSSVHSYSVETSINYLDYKTYFSSKADLTKAAASYYFVPVETDAGPYAEASFLARSSSVTAAYYDGLDLFGSFGGDGYGLSGRYISQQNNIVLGLGLDRIDNEFMGDGDFSATKIEVGYYFVPSARLMLNVDFDELEEDDGDEEEIDKYRISYKQLFTNAGGTFVSLNIFAEHRDIKQYWYSHRNQRNTDSYDASFFEIDVDYYFNRQVSLGFIAGDISDHEYYYGIDTGYYASSAFGFTAEYRVIEGGGENLKYYTLGLVGRF